MEVWSYKTRTKILTNDGLSRSNRIQLSDQIARSLHPITLFDVSLKMYRELRTHCQVSACISGLLAVISTAYPEEDDKQNVTGDNKINKSSGTCARNKNLVSLVANNNRHIHTTCHVIAPFYCLFGTQNYFCHAHKSHQYAGGVFGTVQQYW